MKMGEIVTLPFIISTKFRYLIQTSFLAIKRSIELKDFTSLIFYPFAMNWATHFAC